MCSILKKRITKSDLEDIYTPTSITSVAVQAMLFSDVFHPPNGMIPPGSHATVSGSSAMNVSTSAQQPGDQTKSAVDSRDFDGFPGIIDGKRLVGVETVLCPVAMHFSHQLIGGSGQTMAMGNSSNERSFEFVEWAKHQRRDSPLPSLPEGKLSKKFTTGFQPNLLPETTGF